MPDPNPRRTSAFVREDDEPSSQISVLSPARKLKYDLFEAFKAHLRRKLKAGQLAIVGLQPGLRAASVIAVLVVKDEAVRFPYLLKYYRDLGVEHFIVIDNGSRDHLQEFLALEIDVSVYQAEGNYGEARYGNDWVNEVLHRHCRGKWILYVDADEFLVVGGATRSIPEICEFLRRKGQRALNTVMVDMYSDTGVLQNVVSAGQDPLEVCAFFDQSGYQLRVDSLSNTGWIKGGLRGRLFFADDTWAGPALNKTPLVRWRVGDAFLKSSHQLWPRSLNSGSREPRGALLHFKFTVESVKKAGDVVAARQHTAEYGAYASITDARFVADVTTRFAGAETLVELGVITPLD